MKKTIILVMLLVCSVTQAQIALEIDSEGYYLISSAADLQEFAAFVNDGNQKINGRLTADIDLSGVANFTPIGLYRDNNSTHSGFNRQYQGTFDGGRHVISNLTVNTEEYYEAGLFSRIYQASIKDLGVVNATITTNNVDGRAGVFVGYNRNCTMTNCWSAGNIVLTSTSGVEAFGGIAGAAGVYKNCWTTYSGPIAATNNPSFSNCYSGAEAIAMAPTGELCYKLNEGAGETVYYQTLGTDDYPTFDNTHGVVYLAVDQNCDGTLKGEASYSNSSDGSRDPHTLVDGICSVCGQLPQAADGYYEISTSAALVKFATMVNSGNQLINGRLTADIDLSSVSNFTPIGVHRDNDNALGGYSRQYQGSFDGGRHVISNLTVNTEEYYEAGLFSRIYKASIKDLGIVNATITTNNPSGRAGAMIGYNRNCTVTNCWSAGNIVLTSTSGVEAFGGIAAAAGTYKNCWTTYNGPIAATNNPSFSNCYSGAEAIAMAPTGELCYKLNEGAGNLVYYQTIGTDAHPLSDATHGIVNQITDAGYATQYIADTDVTIPAGVKAYTGKVNGDYLTLTEVTEKIPAAAAVVLEGTEGYYSFVPTTDAAAVAENDLKGTPTALTADGSQYVLAKKDDVVGFYQAADGTIAAGKAYLTGITAGVKVITFGTATGLVSPLGDTEEGAAIYDLSGRRVEKATKGIYIINGKKVLK